MLKRVGGDFENPHRLLERITKMDRRKRIPMSVMLFGIVLIIPSILYMLYKAVQTAIRIIQIGNIDAIIGLLALFGFICVLVGALFFIAVTEEFS